MPSSYTGLDHFFLEDLHRWVKPKIIFDVGSGHGKIAKIVREGGFPDANITGWEVFPVELLGAVYNKMLHEDFLAWVKANVDWEVDLVVFGDVLEHFQHSEALDVLHEVAYRCKWIALFTPQLYFQGAYGGNIAEAHRCILTIGDLSAFKVVHYICEVGSSNLLTYCLLKGLVA